MGRCMCKIGRVCIKEKNKGAHHPHHILTRGNSPRVKMSNPQTRMLMRKGIEEGWAFMAFAREFGPKVQVGQFKNSETGEVFHSVICTDIKGSKTFVSFSDNLGELSPSQIAKQKDDLRVVKLTSGSYILCKQGDTAWQDVDLDI